MREGRSDYLSSLRVRRGTGVHVVPGEGLRMIAEDLVEVEYTEALFLGNLFQLWACDEVQMSLGPNDEEAGESAGKQLAQRV